MPVYPTYEYRCTACGHEWQVEQRITEPPRRVCPRCRRKTAQRQIAAGTAFALKGPRWGRDGYHG